MAPVARQHADRGWGVGRSSSMVDLKFLRALATVSREQKSIARTPDA
jgi:hypothetical protein